VRFHSYIPVAAFALLLITAFFADRAAAQSRDQNFPTALTFSEVNGSVAARDIGDARLTTYFYTFDGGQGDIFMNVVTKNLSGDIDIFMADSMQPIAKVVVYADALSTETGRLIYLRKPARLMLRVQGRTPNDEPATFRIKFAGSFIALEGREVDNTPTLDSTGRDDSSGIRVNSVGTILERRAHRTEAELPVSTPAEPTPSAALPSRPVVPKDPPKSSELPPVIPAPDVRTVFGNRTRRSETPTPKADPRTSSPVTKTKPIDPMASIYLRVQLKDGGLVERVMSDVVRFGVDKGVLTIVNKGGKIERYQILNVEKLTIE